jgi:threonine synthase
VKLISLDNTVTNPTWERAIFEGCTPSGSLYFPEKIDPLPKSFFANLVEYSITEIAEGIIPHLFKDSLPQESLRVIAGRAVSFAAPLVEINPEIFALELFHGPTYAFKDYGARIMAELMSSLRSPEKPPLTILSATSGDTGGAVAHAFFQRPGFRVVVLYPAGRVSPMQEQQFATLGENVIALKVQGSFDDCQALVKRAFVDQELRSKLDISSANSINIGRLLPQSFYYVAGYAAFLRRSNLPFGTPLHVAVPSGNFGNIVAGAIARRLGTPLGMLIAATNSNRTFIDYLQTGLFTPRPSVKTISNAMDVGNPNNFPRLMALCAGSYDEVKRQFTAFSYTDEETKESMRELFGTYQYVCDPHGAVGYRALKEFLAQRPNKQYGMFLHTAHPAKFSESVAPIVGDHLLVPPALRIDPDRRSCAVEIDNDYEQFKALLLAR